MISSISSPPSVVGQDLGQGSPPLALVQRADHLRALDLVELEDREQLDAGRLTEQLEQACAEVVHAAILLILVYLTLTLSNQAESIGSL